MGNGPPRPSFGRRNAQRAPAPVERGGANAATQPVADPEPPVPSGIDWTDHDAEVAQWKRARGWRLPWRQISLTASLCFGIASQVLPDTVNEAVQWLLYALAAASLYSGLRRRRAP